MTVAELIDALKQYPPHFRVSLCQVISRDGTISSLGPLHRFPSDPSPA